MKRAPIIFLLTISLLSATPSVSAYTIFDPGNYAGRMGEYAKQLLQYASEVSTEYSSEVTAIQQMTSTIKQTVFDPLQDVLRLVAIAESGKQIKNLVLGGGADGTSLLKIDPQEYLMSIGDSSVEENIDYVSNVDGIYSDSILSSVISKTRTENGVKEQLAAASQSTIPTTVQDHLCNNDDVRGKLALSQVENADGTYDNNALQQKKDELYDVYCLGNPATDKVLASNLMELSTQQPEAGGTWSTWLQTTGAHGGGAQNSYTQNVKATTVVAVKKAEKMDAKKTDLESGGGIASKTECGLNNVDLVDNTFLIGHKYCPEGKEKITNLGSQLSASYKEAINSPLDLLKSSYGSQGLFAMIGDVIGVMGMVGTDEGGAGSFTPTIPAVDPSTWTHTLVPGSYEANLMIDPMKKIFNKHLESLDELTLTDNKYITSLDNYISDLASGKSCYDGLITRYQKVDTVTDADGKTTKAKPAINKTIDNLEDPRFTSAFAFYLLETDNTNKEKTRISTELVSITTTQTLINNTYASTTISDSIEEIQFLFTDYQNKVDNTPLPGIIMSGKRVGELMQFDSKITQSKTDLPEAGILGALAKYSNLCTEVENEYDCNYIKAGKWTWDPNTKTCTNGSDN